MKAYLSILALLLVPGLAEGRRYVSESSLLTGRPTTETGLAENGYGSRRPASVTTLERNAQNRRLCEKIEPGQTFMIKNSVNDWDDRIVTVADKFEDCSVRVRMANGKKAFVKFKNLSQSLSPEVDCVKSHGTMVCKDEMVFYPARTSSMEIPEAPIVHAFEHGVVVVRDGADFALDAKQVGKIEACAPQKENICVGKYVHASAYKIDRPFEFEGLVKRVYSNGVAVVETGMFKYPIDVAALKERVASDDGINDPSVITRRDSQGQKVPFNVVPLLEPGSVNLEIPDTESAR